MRKTTRHLFALSLLLAPGAAQAQLVNNGDDATGYLVGSRSAPVGGLISSGAQWGTFTLGWNISYNVGTQDYTYVYTASGFTTPGGGGLSHLIFQFTEGCEGDTPAAQTAGCVGGVSYTNGTSTNSALTAGSDYVIQLFTAANGNTGMPGSVYGLKLNTGGAPYNNPGSTFTFTTAHAPVWGDFYAKGGSSNYAYDANFGLASGDLGGYIVRPDGAGVTTTPEPASLALLGSGLLGLGGAVLRRRRQG